MNNEDSNTDFSALPAEPQSRYANTLFVVPPSAEAPPGFPLSVHRSVQPRQLLELLEQDDLVVAEVTADQLEWLNATRRFLWPSTGETPAQPRDIRILRGFTGEYGGAWSMNAHHYDSEDALELLASRADGRQERMIGREPGRDGQREKAPRSFRTSLRGLATPSDNHPEVEDDEP